MAEISISSGSGRGQGPKVFKKSEDELKQREPAKIDLDLSHKDESLKPIPKKVLTKFLKDGFAEISNRAKVEMSHVKMDDRTHILTIFTQSEKQGEEIVNAMMHKVAYDLGNFLEKETGEDRKKFYRSITLFESSVEQNRVSVRWA